jgi:hypothetical protein
MTLLYLEKMIQSITGKKRLFKLFVFFVFDDFFAVLAVLFKQQFCLCIQLISGRDVIPVFANSANEPQSYSVFSLFGHKRYFSRFCLGFEE